MKSTTRFLGWALLLSLMAMPGCLRKRLDLSESGVPGNTLILEFSRSLRYVMDLKIDGEAIPITYGQGRRFLWVEGLAPGPHHFNIHSISYVFGPEFEHFTVTAEEGAYFFIQARKYRIALPKRREQVSIWAYKRHLKKLAEDTSPQTSLQKVTATFRD